MPTLTIASLLLAAGYAALHGAVAVIYDVLDFRAGSLAVLPAAVPVALLVWLFLVGGQPCVSYWRLLLTGYLVAAANVLVTIGAIVTVSVGHFDPWAMLQMTTGVLPRALAIYGTETAVLTLLYGLTVRFISSRLDNFRKVLG